MIIFLDGAYGVGKTSVAESIKRKLADRDVIILDSDYYYQNGLKDNFSWVFGGTRPENNVGFVTYFKGVIESNANNADIVIAIMSYTDDISVKEIIRKFQSENFDCRHYILMASDDVIKSRIEHDKNRDSSYALQWYELQNRYLKRKYDESIFIDTEKTSIENIADEVVTKLYIDESNEI